MKFTVQQEVRVNDSKGWGPQASVHEMAEDLVGTFVTLERGSRPMLRVLAVNDSKDGIRCFSRVVTGPSKGSTAAFPLSELGPCVQPVEPPPYDRWST